MKIIPINPCSGELLSKKYRKTYKFKAGVRVQAKRNHNKKVRQAGKKVLS